MSIASETGTRAPPRVEATASVLFELGVGSWDTAPLAWAAENCTVSSRNLP